MSWRTAFLTQARNDNEVRAVVNRARVPYAHQLHYLQMMTEKLAKGYMTASNAVAPPAFSHAAFVRFLQAIKGRPEIRRSLEYENVVVFRSFIDSLLPVAEQVQGLAPNFAGHTQPNPEYPWRPQPGDDVIAPCEFEFPDFGPGNLRIAKLVRLIEGLLRIAS